MSAGLSPGTVVGGDFRIEQPLAAGGMGAVFIATQLSTGRRRALKVMHALLVADPTSRERFLEEARIGSRIESEHVVEVVGAGVDVESGSPWLAMELLEGETLAERVGRVGRLSAADLLPLMQGLRHGLGRAHEQGIVHRDLKPENLFIARARGASGGESLKILDFGIAKLLQGGKTAATQNIAGSPLWMAPEQADGGAIRPATDVWAIGLIVFDALVGVPYWRSAGEGATLTRLLVEILTEPLEPASVRAAALAGPEVAASLPRELDAFFARCVARDSYARFRDAGQALDALDDVLRGVPMRGSPSDADAQHAEGPLLHDALAATAPSLPPGAVASATALRATAATVPAPAPAPTPTGPGATVPGVAVAPRARGPLWLAAGATFAALVALGGWLSARRDAPLASVDHSPPLTRPTESAPLSADELTRAAQAAIDAQDPPSPRDDADPGRDSAPGIAAPPAHGASGSSPAAAPSPTPAPPPSGAPAGSSRERAPRASPPPPAQATQAAAAPASVDARRFRSTVMASCWRDNLPADAAPATVTVHLGFGAMDQVSSVRVEGTDHVSFRACVVARGATFRVSEPPAEPTLVVRAHLP